MKPEITRGHDFFVIKYDQEYIRGVMGGMDKTLRETVKEFDKKDVEFSEVRAEPGREFLAGSVIEPYVDLTLVRLANGESSLLLYSLNADKAREISEHISTEFCFRPRAITNSFVETSVAECRIEELTYNQAGEIAQMLSIDITMAWAAVRYSNFLAQYRGVSPDQSLKQSAEKFGLKIDF